jgi:hypothetical protein
MSYFVQIACNNLIDVVDIIACSKLLLKQSLVIVLLVGDT